MREKNNIEEQNPGIEAAAKVRFPISLKLVSMITFVFLFSLGLISGLVWFLVHRDTRTTAEENNLNINTNAALAAETVLESVRANGILLLQAIAGGDSRAAADSFFNTNTSVAALIIAGTAKDAVSPNAPSVLVNNAFFESNELDPSMANRYAARVFSESNGAPALINAAPFFNGFPLLCFRFLSAASRRTGASYEAAVLFASEALADSYGTGANTSFLINNAGTVLIHPDRDLIRDAAKLDDDPLIQKLLGGGTERARTFYTDAKGQGLFAAAEQIVGGEAFVITTIASDVVFEGINTTTRRNLYLSLGTWFLGVLFIWFFSRSISGALEQLREAAEAIEDGRYHLKLQVKNHDEIGLLTESMISMSHVLINFEKFTNKTIAVLARKGRLETGGTDRDATIFFSDIRSFTSISEKLHPAEVVEFLNDYMDRMVSCILITGGVIDKFIGDAIMAHWGAVGTTEQVHGRSAAEQNALNGVRAALMMRAALLSFNEGRGGEKKPLIKAGCGLNSGHVVAGQIGSEEKLEYTVIGDTVSLANLAESLNKTFGTEILITEDTWRLAGKYLVTRELPAVSDKGKTVRIFAVINMRDGEESTRLMEDLEKLPKMNPRLSRLCVGPGGPQTLRELRTMLGIAEPDPRVLKGGEKKYRLSAEQDKKGSEQ
ncbi:MAG: HAMP domain-containing protein [Spirochaetaceae bacterium]|jgi:adenylate cyclase|nr:HAMP domain-containing protein [Spirochaetaceae bacterium]